LFPERYRQLMPDAPGGRAGVGWYGATVGARRVVPRALPTTFLEGQDDTLRADVGVEVAEAADVADAPGDDVLAGVGVVVPRAAL
jgi:hypothetical protein